jgi:hypothetical protein
VCKRERERDVLKEGVEKQKLLNKKQQERELCVECTNFEDTLI